MFEKFIAKKGVTEIKRNIKNAKNVVASSKDKEKMQKNLRKLKDVYIKSITEMKEFVELEKDPEEMTLVELDETLNTIIEYISQEYNIDLNKIE